MNAPHLPSATHTQSGSSLSTIPQGVDQSDILAPLDKHRVDAMTTPLNRGGADQTQTESTISTSDTVRLDLNRYQPLFKGAPPLQEKFRALQRWEGVVLEVLEDTFTARLVPLQGEGGDQEAEIYLEELDRDDRALIEPGAIFYWSIGYLDRPSGRCRASIILFRRLPPWTRNELLRAEARAEELAALFADA